MKDHVQLIALVLGVNMEVVALHVVQEKTKTYSVTTPAQHGGEECPANHGDIEEIDCNEHLALWTVLGNGGTGVVALKHVVPEQKQEII